MVQYDQPPLLGVLKFFPTERADFTGTPTFPAVSLRNSLWADLAARACRAWPGRQEARKLLDPRFWNTTSGKAGDLGALQAKSEPPSQHWDTDTDLWTWKLKFSVTFQTYRLDFEQAGCCQWIQPAFPQKCTENISVKHFEIYEYMFSNKTLLHDNFSLLSTVKFSQPSFVLFTQSVPTYLIHLTMLVLGDCLKIHLQGRRTIRN